MNKVPTTPFKRVLNCFLLYLGCFFVSLMTCLGLAMLMNSWISKFLVGCVTLMVFSIPIYTTLWTWGSQDHNKILFGHMQQDYYTGFKIGLLASIPMFIFSLLLIPVKLEIMPNIIPLYKILNAQVWPFLNLIESSVYTNAYSWIEIIGIMMFSFIPSIVCGVGYILGLKDISPAQKIMYKRKTVKK